MPVSNNYDALKKSLSYVEAQISIKPKIAIVLGSGLGAFGECVENTIEVRYSELPGFPVSTVRGHNGRFLFGTISGVPVVVMQGRVHYYEGYEMQDVVLPIRLMRLLGAEKLILTNAAGGINQDYAPGDLVQLTGHISSFVPSPLRGENIAEFGERFPDMSAVYDKEMLENIKKAGQDVGVSLKRGVYVQTLGPNFETPEEIRMYATLGADLVGMSTACEAMAARHMGMRIAGISCVSNMAAGISPEPLSAQDIEDVAERFSANMEAVLRQYVAKYSVE